ncbi:MAG: hypothetical protein RRC07_03590, partial [Anaerolineae bacterium]|nr:hypothetical protein [Anaerolineae bacterium]
ADFVPLEVKIEDGVLSIEGPQAPSRADDPGPAATVEKREVPEGTITEITEVIDSPAIEPEVMSTLVYTNVIEVPEGIIVEQVEVINPSAELSSTGGEPAGSADFVPLEVKIEDGVLSIEEPQAGNVAPQSWSIFADDLYATCAAGAKFEYSSSNGTSYYTLRWSSGGSSNQKTCSGTQCNYTISTAWSAHYTYADAQILAPDQVWGPPDAYRCN